MPGLEKVCSTDPPAAPSPPSPKLQSIDRTGDQLSKVAAANRTGCRTVAAARIESDGKVGPAPSKPAAWMIVFTSLSRDQTAAPSPVAPTAICGSTELLPSSESSSIPDQGPPADLVRPSMTVGLAPERAQAASALPLGSSATRGVTTVWVSPDWVRSWVDCQAPPAGFSRASIVV